MGKGFKPQRYTQTPNVLFDKYLADMGLAELKVVMAISRKTFGWHQTGCRISIKSLATLTGLSENGVLSGARAAQKRGILKKISGDRRITYWELIVENSASEVVEPAEISTSVSEVVGESPDNGTASASEVKLPQPVRQTTSASEVIKRNLLKESKNINDSPNGDTQTKEKSKSQYVQNMERLETVFAKERGVPLPDWSGDCAGLQKSWRTPVKRLLKLCDGSMEQTEQLVKMAVKKMIDDEMTLIDPRGVEKVAQSIHADMNLRRRSRKPSATERRIAAERAAKGAD